MQIADDVLIRESIRQPDRFAPIFDRHATAAHRYLARRIGAPADDLLAGSIVSYRDPANSDLDLHVRWTPEPDTSPDSDIEGFQSAHAATVNRRPARLVQAKQFWRLTATLADGSGFTLMAPRSFTRDQVTTVANSVQLSRS